MPSLIWLLRSERTAREDGKIGLFAAKRAADKASEFANPAPRSFPGIGQDLDDSCDIPHDIRWTFLTTMRSSISTIPLVELGEARQKRSFDLAGGFS